MGYYTTFSLRAVPEFTEEMSKYIDLNEEMHYVLGRHGEPFDSGRWYDHEKDMMQMSKQFPKTLFILSGEGEENGDQWRKYFIGGKCVKEVKAEVTFEHVDESELLKKYG